MTSIWQTEITFKKVAVVAETTTKLRIIKIQIWINLYCLSATC